MSVYKSQQRKSAVKYVSEARNFRVETIRTMKHFPNSYRYIFVNKILDLASDIYINCCNKIFFNWVRCKRLSFADVYQSYQSWRAHAKRCNCYHTLHNMDLFFGRIFHAVHST